MPARRVPDEQKQFQGTFKPSRAVDRVDFTGSELPKAPSWLPREAKKEFKRVLKYLASVGTEYVTSLDQSALLAYCINYAAWLEAERKLLAEGPIVSVTVFNKASGNPVGEKEAISPHVRISQVRQAAMLKAIQALGFDPRSRESISVKPTKKKTTLKKWEQKTFITPVTTTADDSKLIDEYRA